MWQTTTKESKIGGEKKNIMCCEQRGHPAESGFSQMFDLLAAPIMTTCLTRS